VPSEQQSEPFFGTGFFGLSLLVAGCAAKGECRCKPERSTSTSTRNRSQSSSTSESGELEAVARAEVLVEAAAQR